MKNIFPLTKTKQNSVQNMGQRNGFSSGDIKKLNAMYRCDKVSNSAAASTPNRPASPATSTATAQRPNRPARPNRPVLNVLGNIMRPFRPRGDEDDDEEYQMNTDIQTNEI